MARVLHLVAAADWDPLAACYDPPSRRAGGFVHCSPDAATLLVIANRFYAGIPGEFFVLEIDTERLDVPLRWEAPLDPAGRAALPPGVRFPHVYGPVTMSAVVAVRAARRDASGWFVAV